MSKKRARGLVIRNNQILLMFRNNKGDVFFSIPGGGQEDIDKSLEDTVVREIFEETSITVKVKKFIASVMDEKKEQDQYLYLCEYIDGEVALGKSTEQKKMNKKPTNFYKPMWVNLDSLNHMRIFPECLAQFVTEHLS